MKYGSNKPLPLKAPVDLYDLVYPYELEYDLNVPRKQPRYTWQVTGTGSARMVHVDTGTVMEILDAQSGRYEIHQP